MPKKEEVNRRMEEMRGDEEFNNLYCPSVVNWVCCKACSAHGSENLNAIIHLENLISIRTKVGCEYVD